MSRRTLLLILAILAALAVSSLRLTIERRDSSPWVGDFPSARRSSRGPVPVSLPFVVGLVVPSVQARRRAMQAKHRERPRALRPWQCWAYWSLSLCCGRRYRSAQRPERVRAWSVRERCESPEVARPHLRSASPRWAGWLPLRCRMPRMPVIDQAHRRPARRYQGAERGLACVQDARRYCHRSALTLVRRYRSSGFGVQFSDGLEARSRGDFDDHVPPGLVTMRGLSVSSSRNNTLKLRLEYCNHWEH